MIEGSGGALARTTSFTYHPITSAPLTVSRLSVDGDSQHTVTYDYDSDYDANYNASPTNYIHQVVQTGKTDTSLSGTAGSSVTYTSRAYYDASNRVTRLEGANGNSEWLEYYPSVADYLLRDRLKSMRMNTSGAASLVSFVNSYDVYGRPTQLRSANGVQTDLIYNSRGQVLYRTVSAGLSSQVDIFTYNLAGNPVSFTTPEGTRVIQDFDAASRMWRRHAETAGASPTMPWSEVFAFDDQGRPTALRRFAGLGTTVTSVCSPTGTEEFCEERSYDNFRRLASVRTLSSTDTVCTGMDCEITFTYDNDGNLERETKVGLNTTSYIRDALNRVTRITLPTGNYSTLTYDINDRVITRKDPRDVDNGGGGGHRVSRYVYDDFGRLISLQTPDTGLLISNFNASSQRIRSRDAAGNTMTYVYDMADRLIGMVAPNPDQSISYVYDETGSVGGITYANTAGRLTSIQAYGSLGNRIFSHFSYDMLGRIVDDIEEGGPALLATTTTNVHYAWGANSELLSLTYPDGKVVSYNQSLQYAPRTKPGAITTVFKGTPALLASNVMYFADGETSAFTFGNGGIWSLTRNHRGEWTRLVSGPSVSPVLDQRYEYDSTGLGLMTAVHLFQGMSNAYDWTYGYDKLNRLTSYTANVRPVFDAYRWRYDEVGNRTAQNYNGALTAYTYADPTKSQLTSLSGAETDSWTYDANGMWATHTSPDGTIRYDYDTRNLLSQLYDVPTGQPLVRYEYDGSLRHWQRTDTRNGTWTQYYYDLRDRVLQEYEFIGVYRNGDKEYSVTDHVYLEDREVARVVLKYFRPCDGCAYVYEDDDIHLVHEDFRKGPFVLEKNWLAGIPGLLGWAGEVDAFGKWQNLGSLPGPDGKVGTADDVPVDFSNLKGFYNTFRDPVDALSTSLGRGSIFSRPSIGARLGGPWESQKAANDLWSARNSAYVPNGSDDLLGALGGKSVGPAPGSPQLPVSVPGRSLSYAEDSNNERAKAGTRAIDKAAEALDKAGDAAKAAKEGHPGSALKDAGLAAVDAGEAIDAAYLYLTGKEIYESVYDWLHDDRQYDDDPEGNYSGASVKYCTEDSSACDSGGGGVWVFGDFHGNHKDYWTHPTNPLGPGVDEGFVPSLDDPMTQKTMKSLMSRRVSWGKDPGPYIDPLQDDYFVTAPGPLQGVALYGGGNRDPLRPEPP